MRLNEVRAIALNMAFALCHTSAGAASCMRRFDRDFGCEFNVREDDLVVRGRNIGAARRWEITIANDRASNLQGLAIKECIEAGIPASIKEDGEWHLVSAAACTWLKACEVCKVMGTTKRVKSRNFAGGWPGELGEPKWVLCMKCWNRYQTLVRRTHGANECRRLINQLSKRISDERKNQDNRRTA